MPDPIAFVSELFALPEYYRRMRKYEHVAPWRRVDYGTHSRQYAMFAEQPDPFAPTAVWMHGGSWQFGSPDILLTFGEYFWKRGYHVYMPSHRRIPRASGEMIFGDICASLQQLQEMMPVPTHMLLGGMSSGGHLATLSALRRAEWLQPNCTIQALLACGAPLSLKHLGASPTRRRLAGNIRAERFATIDPLAQLDAQDGPPPFPGLVIHGTADGMVPYTCAVAFVARARAIGWDRLRWHSLPGGHHLDATGWLVR